jgi:hypothetical protein
MASRPGRRITFYLDDDLYDRFEALCADVRRQHPGLRMTRSDTLRAILENWLRQDEQPPPRHRRRA